MPKSCANWDFPLWSRSYDPRFAAGEEAVFNALLEDPRRLVLPIVRNGKEATVGYRPEEWERWL